MFRVGQKAVYRGHGVGTIECIENLAVGGASQEFYVLKIHNTGAKIHVPTGAAQSVGLRSVISMSDVEQIYDVLKAPSHKSSATWNRRYRALNDKLNRGDLTEVAEVLRDLTRRRGEKELSYVEKDMLKKAHRFIVAEISAAKNMDRMVVEGELSLILMMDRPL